MMFHLWLTMLPSTYSIYIGIAPNTFKFVVCFEPWTNSREETLWWAQNLLPHIGHLDSEAITKSLEITQGLFARRDRRHRNKMRAQKRKPRGTLESYDSTMEDLGDEPVFGPPNRDEQQKLDSTSADSPNANNSGSSRSPRSSRKQKRKQKGKEKKKRKGQRYRSPTPVCRAFDDDDF